MQSQRSQRGRVARALVVLVFSALAFAPEAGAAGPNVELGVYRGAANVDGVERFEQWAGRRVTWVLDYFPSATWSDIESPTWWVARWAPSPYKVVYSVPLLPDSGGTLAEGATGAYDSHFVKLARTLVAGGEADAVLRLGWEFNGAWFRWTAKDDPAAFAAYWRQIVDAMRSVSGARFKFDWCPVLGLGAVAPDKAYPGDAYVDYIGLDVYDQGWHPGWQDPARRWSSLLNQPYGLRWQHEFAAAHGKAITFPEWALAIRRDGHGGGDNPDFIRNMRDWIAAHNVAYHMYFDFDTSEGEHRLMQRHFPLGAARYRELFGPATVSPAGGEGAGSSDGSYSGSAGEAGGAATASSPSLARRGGLAPGQRAWLARFQAVVRRRAERLSTRALVRALLGAHR